MKQNIAKDNNLGNFIVEFGRLACDPVDKSVSCKSKNRAVGDTMSDWKKPGVFLKSLWKTPSALSTTSKQSSLANVRNVPHETFHR